MRKLFLLALAFLAMTNVNAQTKEDMDKSEKRAKELQALCDNYPKESGSAEVDGYGKSVYDAALMAIANSEQLETLYYRQIGETKDGVTDVTIIKPTLDEWVSLGTTITTEGVSVKNAVDKAKGAAEAVKKQSEDAKNEKNPMKAAKTAKQAKAMGAIIEFGNAATPILLEESGAQAKAIQQIISTLKSGGNL